MFHKIIPLEIYPEQFFEAWWEGMFYQKTCDSVY